MAVGTPAEDIKDGVSGAWYAEEVAFRPYYGKDVAFPSEVFKKIGHFT